MKIFLPLGASLLVAGATLHAQVPVASAIPVESDEQPEAPAAEPVAKPSPSPQPTPTPAPTPTPTQRELVNSLSQGDVQETLRQLKMHYINPSAMGEDEVYRATLEGFLHRLGPGAKLLPVVSPETAAESPFRAEILDDRIGYLRLGSLSDDNIAEMDAALQNFANKKLGAVILDLRATPPGSEFDKAAEVAKRFTPKGRMLFAVKRPSEKQERIFTSNQDPAFRGLIAVAASERTAGAAEVIAATLRHQSRALLVGGTTAGQAVEYADLPLHGGRVLRVAVAEVTLPDQQAIYPNGLKPDVAVEIPAERERSLLEEGLKSGVSQLVFEKERARMNEAALVAGRNPEVEDMEESLRQGTMLRVEPLRDETLQRAVDLLTTLAIYEKQPGS